MAFFALAALSLALQGPALPPDRSGPAPSVMEQIAGSWDDLNPGQRERALRNYQNYMALPQEKRRDIDQRYEKWKRLPSGDQERFRRKHDEYRGRGLVDD